MTDSNESIMLCVYTDMRIILLYCLAILFIACDDDRSSKGNYTLIDSDIKIEMQESPGENTTGLVLYCKTETQYPCSNYPIITKERSGEKSIEINFISVEETDFCLTAIGPATVSIDFKAIANGEYEIELNNGNKKNKGVLKVTDDKFELIFGALNGIEIVEPVLERSSD